MIASASGTGGGLPCSSLRCLSLYVKGITAIVFLPGLEEEQEEGIVDAMFERNAEAGETIITCARSRLDVQPWTDAVAFAPKLERGGSHLEP